MLLNEIQFCEYFESNLLNKIQANFDVINRASKLLGRSEAAVCPSCAKNEYVELRNVYNRMLPAYEQYKKEKVIEELPPIQELEDVYTRYDAIELIDEFGEIKKFKKKK